MSDIPISDAAMIASEPHGYQVVALSVAQNLERQLTACKDKLVMLEDTGRAIIDDLVIRAKLAEDDSLNVSDSILQSFEQTLAAAAEDVAKHRAEIEAQAIELVLTKHSFLNLDINTSWLCDSIRAMAAEKRGA